MNAAERQFGARAHVAPAHFDEAVIDSQLGKIREGRRTYCGVRAPQYGFRKASGR